MDLFGRFGLEGLGDRRDGIEARDPGAKSSYPDAYPSVLYESNAARAASFQRRNAL